MIQPFRVLTLQLSLLGLLVLSGQAAAQSTSAWNEFLGPAGRASAGEIDLPTQWSEDSGIRWKVNIEGKGWSSPVVSNGKIFLTTAVPDAEMILHSLRVLCIDAQSGSTLWNQEVFHHQSDETIEIHSKNSHASPTPILDGDKLFVHFGPHGTACLTTDGEVVWKNQELTYLPQHGNGGSPALAGELLIICCDGKDVQYVAALQKSSGKLAWKVERDTEPSRGFSFSTPTIIPTDDGRLQAVCPGSSTVFSYDAFSGKELWRVNYGEGYSVVPRPVYGGALVYVCSGYGDEQMFAIDPTGRGDITDSHVKWSVKKATPKNPTPILVQDRVYMVSDNGVATCMDATTGNVVWQERLGGNYSASPIANHKHIYFQSENGLTTIVKLGDQFEVVAKNQIGDGILRTFATLAVVDSDLILRSESSLYRIQH